MTLGLYLHPVDLDDLRSRGGLRRLAELGFTDLLLAAAYHAGRWYTPSARGGRVRFLEDGVVHFRPRDASGPLRPRAGADVPQDAPSPVERAVALARDAGLRLHAWTVCFHNTRLGELHPDECVTNAFGDRYSYGLCPARPAVQTYGLDLVRDLCALGVDGIELEAAGWIGHRHGSHHDKSSFAFDGAGDFLLSYCFCTVCRAGLDGHRVDPDALAARVRQLVAARYDDADAIAPPPPLAAAALAEPLGAETLERMLAWRQAALRAWVASLRATAGRTKLALQLQPDPFATGSQLGGLPAEFDAGVDELVLTHYGEPIAQAEATWRRMPALRCARRASFWPKAPQVVGDGDLARIAALAREHRLGVAVYHAGLLPWRTIERVAGALRAE